MTDDLVRRVDIWDKDNDRGYSYEVIDDYRDGPYALMPWVVYEALKHSADTLDALWTDLDNNDYYEGEEDDV